MNILYVVLGIILLIIVFFVVLFVLRKMKGSIVLIPEKYNYKNGEEIKGKIVLKLKKSIEKGVLIAGIKCERTDISRNSKGSSKETFDVFDFNQPLINEQGFSPNEYNYDFSLNVPSNYSKNPNGTLGQIIKGASFLMGNNSTFRWYLYSELKCEGVNLSKKVQINIS